MDTLETKRKRKPARPVPAPAGKQWLNDPEAAFELGCGLWKLFELQRTDPAFPPPAWLGRRSKRHNREELQRYIEAKRIARHDQPERAAA